MTYLLDTHVWLWMVAEPEKLSKAARELILDPANRLLLSAASSWEIAIKASFGRLRLPESPATFVPSRMRETGVDSLPIEHAHALAVADLDMFHRDPFDRLLVAQSIVESTPLITADVVFAKYPVETIWE